ncbi:MAG: T9SS type A sorting domain-containing protein [Ignavibacteriaceae bacterium]|nr:T9SS type A sorting domain-containing protein [Ignavibacteriaceae bacterium]
MKLLYSIVIIFIACGIILPQPKSIYVNANAIPGGDGTISHPFIYINQGIASAAFGDSVHVMGGLYTENVKMVNGVSLIGEGADKCIINDSLPELKAADSCVIKGFTFNQTITCNGVSPQIIDNIIHTAVGYLPGIRIMLNSSPVVIKNYITGGEVGITLQSGCNPLITNNIIRASLMGIQSSMLCKSKITNNVIMAATGTVINLISCDSTIIENNILSGSPDDTVKGISVLNSNGVVISYNDFWNTTITKPDSSGNMSEDPLFVKYDSFDYHFRQDSPCKNAGDPNPIYNNIDGSRNDLGAYGGPNGTFEIITTGIKKTNDNIPTKDFVLGQNYPNPFNPSTNIRYEIPTCCKVLLRVYDIAGREISTLVNEVQTAGIKTATFNSKNLASGIYIYRLSANKFTLTKKMIILK